MLAVSDTGCGMDAETQARIFEPFFTTKEKGKGTGLGLATVYGIVKQSGGNIWVVQRAGPGNDLQDLSAAASEEVPVPVGPERPPAPGARGSETILLVEDDGPVRELVSTVLKSRGFEVICAASGEEAIRISSERASPIHVMVSDTVMPGLGGRELAERMAALRPEMKVLLMSGYTDDMVLQFQIRNRDVAFLQKPFTPEALARKVVDVLQTD